MTIKILRNLAEQITQKNAMKIERERERERTKDDD
jgi:hypothetical protein